MTSAKPPRQSAIRAQPAESLTGRRVKHAQPAAIQAQQKDGKKSAEEGLTQSKEKCAQLKEKQAKDEETVGLANQKHQLFGGRF